MKNTVIGIYGASGFGREVMPLVLAAAPDNSELVFVDDRVTGSLNGYSILSFDVFRKKLGVKQMVLAIAESAVRQKLSAKCKNAEIGAFDVIANNVTKGDEVEIGEGSILCGFTAFTSNITIGRYFHANIYSYVAHDCVIGDFVTFAPGVKCNGTVNIGDHAYIGTGAILKQGKQGKPLKIGAGAVVGMGAVVTKDVPDNITVVGNPARPFPR